MFRVCFGKAQLLSSFSVLILLRAELDMSGIELEETFIKLS
jgi:hypothetical protein